MILEFVPEVVLSTPATSGFCVSCLFFFDGINDDYIVNEHGHCTDCEAELEKLAELENSKSEEQEARENRIKHLMCIHDRM